MSTDTIDAEKTTTMEPDAPQVKGMHTAGKKAKPAKKTRQPKKAVRKPQPKRANKKAAVIAMLLRPNGATLAESSEQPPGKRTQCGAQQRTRGAILPETSPGCLPLIQSLRSTVGRGAHAH